MHRKSVKVPTLKRLIAFSKGHNRERHTENDNRKELPYVPRRAGE